MVLEDEFVPLVQRQPGLPTGLAAVVHRALAKAPQDRFRSVVEMRKALLPFAKASSRDAPGRPIGGPMAPGGESGHD